jgi:hypothetical protein
VELTRLRAREMQQIFEESSQGEGEEIEEAQ